MRIVVGITVITLAALVAMDAPAAAARARGDALSGTARSLRKSFKHAAAEAERTFAGAALILQKGILAGTTSDEQAALGFGDALGYYAISLKALADDTAVEFADAATAHMQASGDEDAAGAIAGDGGSFDTFTDTLRGDLAKLRAKAGKRARSFARVFERSAGARTRVRFVLGDWTVAPRPVPSVDGGFPLRDEPLRLWGVVLARLDDGRVTFSVFGAAAASQDNRFDVRLEGRIVRPLGDLLADGGMDVSANGTWLRTGTIGDPFAGDGVETGARQVHLGVEPEDQGLAGVQPRRLVHAAAVSVP